MVRKQIEYYLSEENLIKDVFLRNKMDKDGFVLLGEIASFQRVASLTQDLDTVVSALKESETIEICDGIKIRPKKDPLRWPFPTNLQLQYLPQPQVPQQPPLIQQKAEHSATRIPTQPQQQPFHHQHQQQQQTQPHQSQQQQQQPQINLSTTAITLSGQQEPDTSSQNPQTQQQQQQQNQKQPQPGNIQLDASSPNNTSISDISSVTNNVDNINRSSLTYATAVTNKPTAASIVAGTAMVAPTGVTNFTASVSSSPNYQICNNSTSAPTNGPTVASVVAGSTAAASIGVNQNNNPSGTSNCNSNTGNHYHPLNNSTPTNGPTVASVVAGAVAAAVAASTSIGSSGSSNSSSTINSSSHHHNNIAPTNGHNHHQPQQQKQNQSQTQSQKQNQSQPQQHRQNQSQPQPIGDIPNKHNKSSTPVESEWKEVKSRRRRPGKT